MPAINLRGPPPGGRQGVLAAVLTPSHIGFLRPSRAVHPFQRGLMPALTPAQWVSLIRTVFAPAEGRDRGIAFLMDLPDDRVGDSPPWAERRKLVAQWVRDLAAARELHPWEVVLLAIPNVGVNNGELPGQVYLCPGERPPAHARDLESRQALPLEEAFSRWSIWLALTEFSATAPLKVAARRRGDFRAATMPGFSTDMIPALRLPYDEIHRRVVRLKELLDEAEGASIAFHFSSGACEGLFLDLRFRTAHASSGLLHENGSAGNLPSGESYIVPYEGERPGEPSRSEGILPVEFAGEIVRYRIEENRAVEVLSQGPASDEEARRLREEPAYGNLAELGLGVLDAFGIQPVGRTLLDEKLGLHIAFGRSDHFGGVVGPGQFSTPAAALHIDRVYVPSLQPSIPRVDCTLVMPGGREIPLIRDSRYVISFEGS